MTTDGTAQAQPQDQERVATPPHLQHDGRVLVTHNEMHSARGAMYNLCKDGKFLEEFAKPCFMTGVENKRYITEAGMAKLLITALRAINSDRLGHAEGCIAYHQASGQMARRYWSDLRQKLLWTIVGPAYDTGMDVESTEELPELEDGPWQVVIADWPYFNPQGGPE